MKRVLFINSICGVGSTGRIIAGIMDRLKAHGVDSLCCYGRFSAPASLNTYRIGSDTDVYIHGIKSRITDRHGLYSKAVTKKLIKKIEEYDPELIHVHNVHGYYLNYKLLFEYLKSSGRRVIWTLHDCWSFTGHCTHFQYVSCDKWKSGCDHCPQLRQYPASYLMDGSDKNYRLKKSLFTGFNNMKLVTPSNYLKDRVGESFLKEYETVVIPTGIDREVFSPTDTSDIRKRYSLEGKKVILGVANPWRERKGLNDFIKLASITDEDTAIVMIGLKEKQKKLLPANIIGIVKTDSVKEMAGWYSLADVFMNLTYEDTFPTTNIEALSCGTPVITYDAGGSSESLNDDVGVVVKTGDVSASYEAFGKIIAANGTKYSREACMKRAGDYRAEDRFEEYIKVYGI
ncbi:MAG: glycosyltransferase [Lachnospiraceae bacterium]|nr:glycosyltransferase [Lachnospiraceae bacterium]